jgi:hypothetical protein
MSEPTGLSYDRQLFASVQRRVFVTWAILEAPAVMVMAAFFVAPARWQLLCIVLVPAFTTLGMMAALRPIDRSGLPREATRPLRIMLWGLGASGYVVALALLFARR